MKKTKTLLAYVVIATFVIFLYSCRKSQVLNQRNTDPIGYFSQTFLKDTTFYNFATSVISGNLKINKILKQPRNNLRTTETDSNTVYLTAAEILTNEYMLEQIYPDFFELAPEQQQQVFDIIRDTLTSPTYREANPENPLIIYELSTIPLLKEIEQVAYIARFDVDNITSGEFWSCGAMTLGAAFLSYGDLFSDLGRLARSGGALTWGTVFNIAFDMVKNASPWWKVAGLAFTFGGCLWQAGLS